MKIKVFTTGGSLDKGYSTRESAFLVQEPQVGNVLQDANVGFEYEIEPLLRKDSLELTDEDRDLILRKVSQDPAERILITHGTDTMARTGRYMARVREKPSSSPVPCNLLPSSAPTPPSTSASLWQLFRYYPTASTLP